MKTDTSTFLAQQIVRLRRRDQIRRLMQRDKTPLAILFMAAVVGTLTGLVGVAFEKAVSWVQNMRIGALVQVADHAFLLWPLAFILSALLAMVGYFLVRKFAPEAGGSGIPEIEGALEELRPVRWWRVLPVKFIGGMGTLGAVLPGDLFKITVIRRDLTESVVIQGDRKKCYSRYIEQKTSNQYKIDKIFKITKPALKPFQKSFKTG